MALVGASSSKTDGASSAAGDPGSGKAEAWDAVLDTAMQDVASESGIDLSAPLPESGSGSGTPTPGDPVPTVPQSASESSAGTPATPPPTGDGGTDPAAPAAPAAPPDGTSQPDPTDSDPLAGAQPFTFDVDGQPRTIEGAFRIPGEGLYVPEARVPHFEQLAARAEQLDRSTADFQAKDAEWDRLTAWTFKDAQGQPQTLHGREAIEARVVTTSRLAASLKTISDAISDPQQFAKLVTTTQDQAGNWYVVPDKDALATLMLRVENATIKAEGQARSFVAQAAKAPPPPAPTAESYAAPTIQAIITEQKIVGLTEADVKRFTTDFARYVERGPDGSITGYSPRLVELMQERAAERAEQAKIATAATAAGKFNGGMNRGRTQAPAAPKPQLPTPATPTEKVGKAQAWDTVLQSALPDVLQTLGSP